MVLEFLLKYSGFLKADDCAGAMPGAATSADAQDRNAGNALPKTGRSGGQA